MERATEILLQAFPAPVRDRHICILGLGYVGLTLAVAMADIGFRVHGVELRQEVLNLLSEGSPHFWEPRLREKLQRVKANGALTFSKNPHADFSASVYIITVGTPLQDGKPQMGSVQAASSQVADVMEAGALVILRSTVKLGTARNVVAPILRSSGRPFELAVCPERTLEGRALIELGELPQIIGSDDPDTRARCAHMFGVLTPTTITLSSLEAAEMTKLIDNTYRDVMFGFANEIAAVCSAAGLSAAEIIRAGKLGYPRTNVAWPGPVGGPCLEKDPHILAQSAAGFGVEMPITEGARRINEEQPERTIQALRRRFEAIGGGGAPTVAMLGLAFKGAPPTDDLRGSRSFPIFRALKRAFPAARFRTFDPVVRSEDVQKAFGVVSAETLNDAFSGSDIVVIMNNHPLFRTMEVASLGVLMSKPGIIYDYWNLHDDVQPSMPEGVAYMTLGAESL